MEEGAEDGDTGEDEIDITGVDDASVLGVMLVEADVEGVPLPLGADDEDGGPDAEGDVDAEVDGEADGVLSTDEDADMEALTIVVQDADWDPLMVTDAESLGNDELEEIEDADGEVDGHEVEVGKGLADASMLLEGVRDAEFEAGAPAESVDVDV